MNRNVSGFYHDPPLYLGEMPISNDFMTVDFMALAKDVFRHTFSNGLQLRATVEGMFVFDFGGMDGYQLTDENDLSTNKFNRNADIVVKRTRLMNAALAFFYTHEIQISKFSRDLMVVTPELTITMGSMDGSMSQSYGNQRVSYLASSRFESTYQSNLPYTMDNRLSFRGGPVDLRVLKAAATDLSVLMDRHGDEGVLLIDLHLRASKAYQDHDHSLSLINNWTIIERLLNELWQKLQADNKHRDGSTFISGERKKRLQDGRTFTASVISEMLSFLDYLPKNIYDDLSKIRKTRNEWMHGLKVVDASTSELAMSVSGQMLTLVKEITVVGASGRRLHG